MAPCVFIHLRAFIFPATAKCFFRTEALTTRELRNCSHLLPPVHFFQLIRAVSPLRSRQLFSAPAEFLKAVWCVIAAENWRTCCFASRRANQQHLALFQTIKHSAVLTLFFPVCPFLLVTQSLLLFKAISLDFCYQRQEIVCGCFTLGAM